MAEGSGRTGTGTILFTDLVGSTALRAALGDVAADKVRGEHDRLLREAIARHGGVLAKGLGDGVMAVFEAAADGAACAVAMQQEIDRLRRRRGLDLAIRLPAGILQVLANAAKVGRIDDIHASKFVPFHKSVDCRKRPTGSRSRACARADLAHRTFVGTPARTQPHDRALTAD